MNNLISLINIFVCVVQRFVNQGSLPHLLLHGPPGTGKTSTILACARKLYSPAQFHGMVLELNASDDRGIGIVRGDILNFAESRPVFSKGFKLVILDEADAMTNDAQNALRRIMEKYTSITRFCLICNYMTKIIPALQSRCTRFRFAPLKPEQIIPRLDHIIREEKLKCTEDAKKSLISLADGDMRRVINTLQSTAMAFDKVITQDNVHKCCGQPTTQDIEEIFSVLTDDSKDIKDVCDFILDLQNDKGLALQDLISRLHLKLLDCNVIL